MGGTGGETGVLDPNFWQQLQGGAAQGAQGVQRCHSGRLVHAKTGNVTVINKENFWIGKGDVDLKIDKDTVSRKHAQILVRQNHYFITDNGSTNKTYLEGKELPPNASVELYNGMHVKFANEEYIFQL
ncbi:MAG: FHA domain-containing protein [Lachnospiraceae bacterium]|nr:FHA domain-containing protein [Lachnospiraceae bacterium]